MSLCIVRENDVAKPSETIAIADAIIGWGQSGGGDPGTGWAYAYIAPYNFSIGADLGTGPSGVIVPADLKRFRDTIRRRHSGRWNVVFCDGHLESLTTAGLYDTRKEAIRRRWNRDHLPHGD